MKREVQKIKTDQLIEDLLKGQFKRKNVLWRFRWLFSYFADSFQKKSPEKEEESNDEKETLLFEVAPLSLGIETGEIMTIFIPRNSTIPAKKSETYADNQPTVIEVTFDINADGIIDVSAQDKSTSNIKKITVKNENGRLSQTDINKMVADTEKFKGALQQNDKDEIDKVVNDTLAWIESQNEEEPEQKEVESKLMPIMQRAYQGTAGTGGMPGGMIKTFLCN